METNFKQFINSKPWSKKTLFYSEKNGIITITSVATKKDFEELNGFKITNKEEGSWKK